MDAFTLSEVCNSKPKTAYLCYEQFKHRLYLPLSFESFAFIALKLDNELTMLTKSHCATVNDGSIGERMPFVSMGWSVFFWITALW